jgi:hypothetical protein
MLAPKEKKQTYVKVEWRLFEGRETSGKETREVDVE